eukprot:Phypoly_transcript_02493.p1 GENE.Phypoly_transcript_02493~~Phypoly_transcript_02493.p1  ORF type:complete len:590 (+),score=110.69 Phypoly_transcript_02493:1010-2779(+)
MMDDFDEGPFLGAPPPPPEDNGQETVVENHRPRSRHGPPPILIPQAPIIPALSLKNAHVRISPASSPKKQGISGRLLNGSSQSPRSLTTPHVQYKVLERLGKGSSGSVYKAVHKETGQIVALKKVAVEDIDDVIQEITIMKNCESPFVIRYFEHYVYDDYLWIAMEYCPTGSVTDLMKLVPHKMLSEKQIAAICKSIASGLVYLHGSKKVHRDVKPENILITETGSVKLADFGIASQLTTIANKKASVVGTPYFMAPEVALYSGGYDSKADVWSLGISAIDMAQSEPPRFDIPPSKVIWLIPHLPPPTLKNAGNFTPSFNHFIAYCLMKEPADRPTADLLLQHPFLSDALDTSEVLADLLGEVRAIIEHDGGLERALKKAKIRDKQAKQQEKDRIMQEKNEKLASEAQCNSALEQPLSPNLADDKPLKKERKKRMIKNKLAYFFQRRPKKEELQYRGILVDSVDFALPFNASPNLGPNLSTSSPSLVSSLGPNASPSGMNMNMHLSPITNQRFSRTGKAPIEEQPREKEKNGRKESIPNGEEEDKSGKKKNTANGEEGEKEDKANKNLIATMFSNFKKRRDSQLFNASM